MFTPRDDCLEKKVNTVSHVGHAEAMFYCISLSYRSSGQIQTVCKYQGDFARQLFYNSDILKLIYAEKKGIFGE